MNKHHIANFSNISDTEILCLYKDIKINEEEWKVTSAL